MTAVSATLMKIPGSAEGYQKKEMKDTYAQMLLRGQNLVGYRHYSDDVVRNSLLSLTKTELTFSGFLMLLMISGTWNPLSKWQKVLVLTYRVRFAIP